MQFKNNLTLVILILSLSFIFGINSEAKTKTMYVKSPTKVTVNGVTKIVPKYLKTKVKLKKIEVGTISLARGAEEGMEFEFPEITLEDRFSFLIVFKEPIKTKIKVVNTNCKIKTKKLTDEKPKFVVKNIPYNTFKSYMSYRAITASGSPQGRMQRNRAYTDYETGVRMVAGRYCVAVGPGVATKIGTNLELIFSNGKIVPAIVADQKAGTVDGFRHADGSAVEFLIDSSALPSIARTMGDMSYLDEFKGEIVKIKVYKREEQ